MTTEQFIASIVHSLAWPAAVIVLALLFRRQLSRLLARPINRLRAGPLEFEFDRLLATVEAEVEPGTRPPAGDSVALELADVAKQAPLAAIMDSFARVEAALRELLVKAGVDVSRLTVVAMTREALARKLISPETTSAIEGIAVLRNLATHGRAGAVSTDRAAEYLALVDALLYSLRDPASS
jgi:hypothetical protein